MQQLGELVRDNNLARRLGRFQAMFDGNKSKMKMMSLDDSLSLFFSVLAVDPPGNAIGLCHWFEKGRDLPVSGYLKYSMAIFVGGVKHILGFTKDLVNEIGNEAVDPLGIEQ
jgi:hypothetical protein